MSLGVDDALGFFAAAAFSKRMGWWLGKRGGSARVRHALLR